MVKKDLTAAFINFFVQTIGTYLDCIDSGKFDGDKFINTSPESLRPFLQQLVGAQMFEIFVQQSAAGVDQSGFDKKIESHAKLQAEMAKLGIDDSNGTSGTVKKRGHAARFKSKGGGWSTLRNQFKRDSPAVDATTVIGVPTLVKTTTERTDGTKVAPPVPKKPQGAPFFNVPSKPLPKAPGSQRVYKLQSANSSNDFINRPAPRPPRQRNTWLPQTSPVDFSNQVAAAGSEAPKGPPPTTGRGRGRGQGRAGYQTGPPRQRPVSIRPTTSSSGVSRPLPAPATPPRPDRMRKGPASST